MTSLSFRGTLDQSAHKTHVPVAFDVPAGTTRLDLVFGFAPERGPDSLFDTMICIALEGPAGWRGMRHNNPDRTISIGAGGATPGFVAGSPEPGRWTFWMEAYRLPAGVTADWTLDITLVDTPEAAIVALPAPAPKDTGPGWYRGDLHAHSDHSDAKWGIADLVAFAHARGLDFATLSDHNTISGIAEMERLAGPDLLVLGGVELTTHYGHALVLGTREWQEWRARSMPGVTMAGIAATAMAQGKIFVIAHPMSPGDPDCTGCRWEHDDVMPGPARVVEIWNGPWSDYNEDGLALYREWLNDAWTEQGIKLMATAGTDHHGTYKPDEALGFNTVFAEGLTQADILDGIAAGRNVLSSGPMLFIEVTGRDGLQAGVGDTLSGQISEVQVMWQGLEGEAELTLVQDGGIIDRTGVADDGSAAMTAAAVGRSWLMAELRAPDGTMLAVTNPVFVEA